MRGLKNKDVGDTTDFHIFYLCQFKIILENDCEALKKIYEWYTSLHTYTYSTTHTAASQKKNSFDCDDQFEKDKIHSVTKTFLWCNTLLMFAKQFLDVQVMVLLSEIWMKISWVRQASN